MSLLKWMTPNKSMTKTVKSTISTTNKRLKIVLQAASTLVNVAKSRFFYTFIFLIKIAKTNILFPIQII